MTRARFVLRLVSLLSSAAAIGVTGLLLWRTWPAFRAAVTALGAALLIALLGVFCFWLLGALCFLVAWLDRHTGRGKE